MENGLSEMDHIKEQIAEIRASIEDAAKAAGRKPEDVKLVAVSKTFPAEAVTAAYNEGQRIFGENKVQELEIKCPILPDDIEWHLIGHLQGNKALKAINLASWIHSVDSIKLVKRIDRLAEENKVKPNILLELNVSGEDSKFGLTDERATMDLAAIAVESQNVNFKGLMTMAPFGADESELRSVFSSLRKLRDRMENEFSIKLPELSMGMSSDFKIAIEEGATFVRIGTAIFGKRSYT
jgi:pyridoxal phosphate enzyme (YggS family)